MKLRSATVLLAFGLSVFALAPAARADVAPPDSCGGKKAGAACSNAGGASYTHAGSCVDAMCPRAQPGPDGGVVYEDYPCVLCSKTPDAATPGDDSSGGCGVGRTGAGAGVAGLLLAAGAIALARGRKR